MCANKVRLIFVLSAAMILFIAGAEYGAFVTPAHVQAQERNDRLKQLLRDRVVVRQEIVDRFQKLKSKGGSSMVEVLISTRDMLWAELDTLSAKAERIAMLQRILEHEKKITAFFEKTPDTPEVDRLLLRVRLLDAEITLEREKLK